MDEKVIDLGNSFGAVALKVNGLRIEVGAGGDTVKVVSDTDVTVSLGRTSGYVPQQVSPPRPDYPRTNYRNRLPPGDPR
jgi:hypothetical protein